MSKRSSLDGAVILKWTYHGESVVLVVKQ